MSSRYWFVVYGNRETFGGACFVAAPRHEMTRPGMEKAMAEAGFSVPPGQYLCGHPCPFEFEPPAAYVGKMLTEDEWRAFWLSCAPPVTS